MSLAKILIRAKNCVAYILAILQIWQNLSSGGLHYSCIIELLVCLTSPDKHEVVFQQQLL